KFNVGDAYDPGNHYQSYYYFRFAAIDKGGVPDMSSSHITVPSNGFIRIWSLEGFELSQRVLGLFGGISDLGLKGLQLIHSPSIDPGFKGALALGIRNLTSEDVELTRAERIGKLLLFDVTECSGQSTITTPDALHGEKQEQRDHARRVILAALGGRIQKL
ncbi:MAG: hypothetical protein HY236_17670, partial [Acidobacteria bacterium]|nr:hypothetical protein [Acidobacteriota bacterium]